MEYDMEPFLDSCVERYCELAKIPRSSLKWVKTPFIDEREAMKQEKEALHHNEEIEEHLAGASAKQPLMKTAGVLSSIASKVLMKVLYAGRLARWDLLRAIGFLANANHEVDCLE